MENTSILPRLLAVPRLQILSDRAGVVASLVCALHCLSMPLLATASVSFPELLGDETVHHVLAGVLILPAAWAATAGFTRHRRSFVPALLVFGLLLVLIAAFGLGEAHETLEIGFTVGGGLVLGLGHILNSRLCARCPVCRGRHDRHEET